MRKISIVFIIAASILRLPAQDSAFVKPKTGAASIPNDSIQHTPAKQYLLYNNTSISLNNRFNEGFRYSANNRLSADFSFYGGSVGVPASFAYNLLFNLP